MPTSDPFEDVYNKYLDGNPQAEREEESARGEEEEQQEDEREDSVLFERKEARMCAICGSEDIDTSEGYRGEYRCISCGHTWQVGGKDSRV